MAHTRLFVFKAGVVLAAVALWFVRLPAWWVERTYSTGVYAWLQPILTSVTNHVPFALFDILAAVLLVLLIVLAVGAVRSSVRLRQLVPFARAAATILFSAAVIYLTFLLLWGLNYEREPLTSHVAFDRRSVTVQGLKEMGLEAVRQVNTLQPLAHERGFPAWGQLPDSLGPAFRALHERLVPGSRPVPGLPKWSLLTPFFEGAGVSGMTDPFFLEVLVDRDLLPFERPFVAAHEWAHLAGYGDEAEANYLGWLTCLGGDSPAAYSGWLYLYAEVLGGLGSADRAALIQAVQPGPRADLRALAERALRIHPVLEAVSWRVYDQYLKANRVEEGVRSYSRALVLVLGTQYTAGWKPVMRDRQGAR